MWLSFRALLLIFTFIFYNGEGKGEKARDERVGKRKSGKGERLIGRKNFLFAFSIVRP